MKEQDNKDKIIEDELLDKTLQYNYTKEIDKLHNHIAQLRLIAISYQNIIKEKDKEIERLDNIINELEDSIVGKINVLYQVRGQSNAIQELNILLRQLREHKGEGKE